MQICCTQISAKNIILKLRKNFEKLLTTQHLCDIISLVEFTKNKNKICECAGIGRQARLRGVCL